MVDSSGNGRDGTYSNAPTLNLAGGLTSDPDTAVRFNGTNQFVKANLALSTTSVVTVECWFYWTAFANDDKVLLEYTRNFQTRTGGFLILPDDSSSGKFQAVLDGDVGINSSEVPRPTANAWHHVAVVFDKTKPAANEVTLYLDGVAPAATKLVSADNTNAFENSTLNLMSRDGLSLFSPPNSMIDDVAIYTRALSPAEIHEHYSLGHG